MEDQGIPNEEEEEEIDFEVEEGLISIEGNEFLIEKAMHPASVVCLLHLSTADLYHSLDSDQHYDLLSADWGVYTLVDDNETARLQFIQELNNLGIHNPIHHRMFFHLLDSHYSRLSTDEKDYPGNKRRCLEINVNFTTYHRHYYSGDEHGFDYTQYRLVPTAKSAIDSLEKLEVESLDAVTMAENCSICFEGIHTEKLATKLPCKHLFHDACVLKWLQSTHFCPLCRFEMPVDG